MTSREKILTKIKSNQPSPESAEPIQFLPVTNFDIVTKFKETLISIGGSIIEVKSESEISERIRLQFPSHSNPSVIGLDFFKELVDTPHSFQTLDVAILRGEFGVAENGSIWITDKTMIDRAVPFICAHLVLIIPKNSLVATLHDAYEVIGQASYELGTFIAGPSKTADIEQSLVLGAHGAKSMTCFLVG